MDSSGKIAVSLGDALENAAEWVSDEAGMAVASPDKYGCEHDDGQGPFRDER